MILVCVLGISLARGATCTAASLTSTHPQTEGFFWEDLDWFLSRIEPLLVSSTQHFAPGEATESYCLSHAKSVATTYETAGFRPDLTPDEVSEAVNTITDLRNKILMNPDMCPDPSWGDFLDTLDTMRSDLIVAVRGGAA